MCPRLPILSAHSESVYNETKEVATIDQVPAQFEAFLWCCSEDDVACRGLLQAKSMQLVRKKPLLVGFARILMREKESTCGLFQSSFKGAA